MQLTETDSADITSRTATGACIGVPVVGTMLWLLWGSGLDRGALSLLLVGQAATVIANGAAVWRSVTRGVPRGRILTMSFAAGLASWLPGTVLAFLW